VRPGKARPGKARQGKAQLARPLQLLGPLAVGMGDYFHQVTAWVVEKDPAAASRWSFRTTPMPSRGQKVESNPSWKDAIELLYWDAALFDCPVCQPSCGVRDLNQEISAPLCPSHSDKDCLPSSAHCPRGAIRLK
jgi:hypothetical protein